MIVSDCRLRTRGMRQAGRMSQAGDEEWAPASKWHIYGFRSTPYSTDELGPESQAEKLLVGRDRELDVLYSDLVSGVSLMALEGDYGVGKSSLAAAAAFGAASWRVRQGSPFFLATSQPLELVSSETVDDFERRAYFQIAQAILVKAKRLRSDGYRLEGAASLSRWLRSPEGSSWNAGIGLSSAVLGGLEVSGGASKNANTSSGFSDVGVISMIGGWLDELFPEVAHGGVILRLDNLENLGRDYRLLETFESLRDRLFKRRGLRWIVSGAEGMVRTALSSPKMTGAFADPMDVDPIPHALTQDVIRRRVRIFQTRESCVLPVDPEVFEKLYIRTGRNLRFSLGMANTYALRADAGSLGWMSANERAEAFFRYVDEEGRRVVEQLASKLTDAAERVLTTLVQDKSGFASPNEHADFGYRTMSSLVAQVRALRDLGLVEYAVDEDDARRRRITVSPNGRLVVALVSKRVAPPSLSPINPDRMGG